MIGFCKKSFNTLFASTALSPPGEDSSANYHRITPLPVTNCGAGLNFLTTSDKIPKSNNLIASPWLINSPEKSDQIDTVLEVLKNGDSDRLASCTESLGFESCNEKSVSNDFQNSEKSRANEKSKKIDKKNKGIKNKSFPPPLSSFNDNGKPTFFLRPVRNNGRLELIVGRIINRPERLRACREDGRLRLHLMESDHKNSDVITSSTDVVGEKSSDNKDEKIVKELKFPVSRGGGDDCRLLHEMANNHQQHNMHGWGHQCVSVKSR